MRFISVSCKQWWFDGFTSWQSLLLLSGLPLYAMVEPVENGLCNCKDIMGPCDHY